MLHVKGRTRLATFFADDCGLAAIEYVIMTCVMGLMLIPTAAFLASRLQLSYDVIISLF